MLEFFLVSKFIALLYTSELYFAKGDGVFMLLNYLLPSIGHIKIYSNYTSKIKY